MLPCGNTYNISLKVRKKMKIYMLEDEKSVSDRLCAYINMYCGNCGLNADVKVYSIAFDLLENYHADADFSL